MPGARQPADLNLDLLLGPRYVEHYLRILRSANEAFWVVPDQAGTDRWTTTVTRPAEVVRDLFFTLHGTGPAECSSSAELLPYPLHCWDVRGYYRRLGVHWRATRRELREAYVASGGPEDARLTYAFRQLLDDEVRRAYDAVPFGGQWLDDEAREEARAEACREAARRTAQSGRPVDYASVLTERGYTFVPRGAADVTGRALPDDQDPAGQPGTALGATVSSWELQWGWYVMQGAVIPGRPGDTLGPWQQMLAGAFRAADLQVRFAVGFFHGKGQHVWRGASGVCIVFLADNEPPSPSLATKAVNGYLAHERKR